MNIAKNAQLKFTTKKCEFIGCTNSFEGSQFQKYCNDTRCIELRKKNWVTNNNKKDKDVKNLILKKKIFSKRLKSNTIIHLRCRARNSKNERCNNTFTIIYDKRREIYPMFCECHRNHYQRDRFTQKGSIKGA